MHCTNPIYLNQPLNTPGGRQGGGAGRANKSSCLENYETTQATQSSDDGISVSF